MRIDPIPGLRSALPDGSPISVIQLRWRIERIGQLYGVGKREVTAEIAPGIRMRLVGEVFRRRVSRVETQNCGPNSRYEKGTS